MGNSVDPGQTAPAGAVCYRYRYTLFAKIWLYETSQHNSFMHQHVETAHYTALVLNYAKKNKLEPNYR